MKPGITMLKGPHFDDIQVREGMSFHIFSDLVDPPFVQRQYKRLLGVEGFRFQPHFHPYATTLLRQLIDPASPDVPGIPALLAMDTRYKTNDADGNWVPLPGTTAAEIDAEESATLYSTANAVLGESPIKLMPGTAVKLSESCRITLPDGTQIQDEDQDANSEMTLPPGAIVPSTRAIQSADGSVTIPYEARVTLRAFTVVELPAGAFLTRGDGSVVRLSQPGKVRFLAGTKMKLLGARPQPELFDGPLFKSGATRYVPGSMALQPYPSNELDFSTTGAYSVYNWELFYHAIIAVAMHLSKNQRFAEAQRWFHYIFDPTDSSMGPTPERFWKVRPFQVSEVRKIEEILVNLASGADRALQDETVKCIDDWKDHPFRPHVIARWRSSAYMVKTVMAYLDNLIAWGDSLFRQDTRESINEATQIYILALNLLGPRPQAVPRKGTVGPNTYDSLKNAGLDEFSNALVGLETDIGFDSVGGLGRGAAVASAALLNGTGSTSLYFCVPRNDKLVGYWDTVADRLFKIHNSLNLQGVFRQLALFDPPIDPALLAKGVAAGLDIGAIVSGVGQPLPLVRFQLLVQKATEICQEVKSLGGGLLAAMEKEDNEALAILRAKHEGVILGLAEVVRYGQLQEAVKAREGLAASLANAFQRYSYYEKLLGREQSDLKLPDYVSLDEAELEKLKLKATEPDVQLRDIPVDISSTPGDESGGKKLSSQEVEELRKLKRAQEKHSNAAGKERIGAGLGLIPDFGIYVIPWGAGTTLTFGGTALSRAMSFWGSFYRGEGDEAAYKATNSARIGGYARREQEWALQSNLAAGEMTQIHKQFRAAEIRAAIAEKEWKNHKKQMDHAKEIEVFLAGERNGKKTSKALYAWMKREVKGLYGQCFEFAYDVAKKAEKALQHETGDPALNLVQFGYLAGNEGLLAGEKLHLDVKRMEMAYHELARREYELTKHASLLQLDPIALMQLRATGSCEISLPEEFFDLDGPGHYFRRIKSVALSIPCVAGPYTSVSCKLTLISNDVRISNGPSDSGYQRTGNEDPRFRPSFVGVQAIVTSSAQNDSGLFETNLRDERYLPFEGAGAISRWRLELPADLPQFDYDTITDAVLHLRYTARDGGARLRKEATDNLMARIAEARTAGSARLFSVRHEFPNEWASFNRIEIKDDVETAALKITLREEHYPFWSRNFAKEIRSIEIFARTGDQLNVFISDRPDPVSLIRDPLLANQVRRARAPDGSLPDGPTGTLDLYFDRNNFDKDIPAKEKIEDLWLLLVWGAES